jgi:hypothetical protein
MQSKSTPQRCRSAPLKTLTDLRLISYPEGQSMASRRISASPSLLIKDVVNFQDYFKTRPLSFSEFRSITSRHKEKKNYLLPRKDCSRLGDFNLVKSKMRSISAFTGQEFSLIDFTNTSKNSKQELVSNRTLKSEIENKISIDNNIILDYSLKREFERETHQKRTEKFRDTLVRTQLKQFKSNCSSFFPITSLSISKLQNHSHGKLRISKIYSQAQKETLESYLKCVERGQPFRYMKNSFLQPHDHGSLILSKISKPIPK